MLKRFWCVIAWVFILILFVSPVAASQSSEKEIVATGEGFIEGENVPEARRLAIDEALRTSVEQALGVFINSESLVKNYEMIDDKIYSNSRGHVKKYDVISEKRLGSRYRVTIHALVSLESIKDDLMALGILKQQMNYPRLMIVVSTRQGKVDEAARSVRIELEKMLARKHFDLVDPETSEKLHNNTKMLLDVTRETVIAAKMGLDHHAEVVLTGIVDTEHTPGREASYDKAKSRLILRVIDPTTAKILVSTEESADGTGSNRGEALSKSGKKIGERAAAYASREIIKWWEELKKSGISFRITLKGITLYPDAILFEDTIQSIGNVVSVNERTFGGGFLECDVNYKGKKSKLIRSIFKDISGKKGFENLNLESSTGNNIIFSKK